MAKHTAQVKAAEKMMMPMPEGRVHLNSKKLAEIKNWQVGKEYKVEITMKQTNMSEMEDKMINAGFEIKSIKVL